MKRQRVTYPNGGFAMHKLVGSWQGTISAYYERDGTLIDAERIDMGRSFPVKRGGPIWTRLEYMGVVFADGPEPRLRRKNPAHRRNPVHQRIAVRLSNSRARRNPFPDRNADE